MAEQAPQHAGHGHGYLPAMGHDRLLPYYDVFTWLLGARSLHRTLADQAGIAPGQRVLEIGCGTGNLTLLAARRQPRATVVGLDPDPLALARARRKSARHGTPVQWDLGSAAALPYPDESVDRVLSCLMLHHIEEGEKDQVLSEARRVLRPGGRLHLVDFAGDDRRGLLSRLTRRHPRLHDNAGDRIPARMREVGLSDVSDLGPGRLGVRFYRATR
ncbi:class I SAM-dependent methyltransferase [Pseudonocardia xinjiangensis]|uniref:class I SAM-dependent methyltransferase n=1 Tax=Pseudonocardia xinjiangensis TaxID=75289 RepID=UPI003D8CA3E9